MPSEPVRVRFAPAPSGYLHVGNARSALFNWLFARHASGTFLLRIEDTDPARAKEEFIAALMDVLRWLGLDWDGEPVRQSARFDRYREAAARMLDEGIAYRCYCTPDELEERRRAALAAGRPPGYDRRCATLSGQERTRFEAEGCAAAIRFLVPEGETVVDDIVHGPARFDHSRIADFVVLRGDGSPTYLLATALDDIEMGITHVIRGEDLLSSTPRQIMIYRAIGATSQPRFAHLPLIVGPDRKPLSKRFGDVSVEYYRENGFLPEAMVNYLALLGWSPGDGVTERFTVQELVELFDLKHVSKNPAAFDAEKLTALNGEKIRALSVEDLASRLEPFLLRAGVLADLPTDEHRALLRRVVPLIQERMARLIDAPEQIRFLFGDVEPDEEARAILASERAATLPGAAEALRAVPTWAAGPIEEALKAWAERSGLNRRAAFQPIRAAVTGRRISPPLYESLELLGRERALARIERAARAASG